MRIKAIFLLLAFIVPTAYADGGLAAGALDEELSALREARDLVAIEQRLARASEDELESPAGLRWQAWLAQSRQETETALSLLERGLEMEPDNVELILMRSGMVLSGLSASGGVSALRSARAMSRELERAVELAPDHAGARSALVQYLQNAPRVAGGSSRKAETHIEAIRQAHTGSYLGLKAQSAMAEGDLDAAIEYFEQALEHEGGHGWQMSYGLALQRAERWDQARAVMTSMVTENPRNGAAWYQLGRNEILSEGDVDSGLAAFERFLDLPPWPGDPSHAAAWWRIGQLHELDGDVDQARQAYQQSLSDDPELEVAREALAALERG